MVKKPATETKTEEVLRKRTAPLGIVRSAGSLGPADYVVLYPTVTDLIQVVGPSDRPTVKEAQALLDLTGPHRRAAIWRWKFAKGTAKRSRKGRRYEFDVHWIASPEDVDVYRRKKRVQPAS